MVLHKETDAMTRESSESESESALIVVLMVVPDPCFVSLCPSSLGFFCVSSGMFANVLLNDTSYYRSGGHSRATANGHGPFGARRT